MAATGVGTAAILATSLVLGATGANDKINAAASKVFGKDTVKIANIAGAMYMAYQAFSGDGLAGADALDPAAAGLETAGAAPLDGSGLTGVSSPLTAAPEAVAGATEVTGAAVASPGGGALSTAAQGGRLDLLAPQSAPGASFDIQTPATSAAAQPAASAAVAPQAPMAPSAPNPVSAAASKAGTWFSGLSPQAQGALVLVGGQTVGGWAQGRAQDRAAQAQRDYDAQYRRGSGLKKW